MLVPLRARSRDFAVMFGLHGFLLGGFERLVLRTPAIFEKPSKGVRLLLTVYALPGGPGGNPAP